jgi:hypothetical protein
VRNEEKLSFERSLSGLGLLWSDESLGLVANQETIPRHLETRDDEGCIGTMP